MTTPHELKDEIADAMRELQELRQGTREILDSPRKKRPSRGSSKQSSWAKSTSKRISVPWTASHSNENDRDGPHSHDQEKGKETSSRTTDRKVSKGFTISKAPRKTVEETNNLDLPFYDVKVEASASHKRPRSAVIMKPAPVPTTRPVADEAQETILNPAAVVTRESHAYSFSKAKRETTTATSAPAENNSAPHAVLDITKGEKLIRERPIGGVFLKEARPFQKSIKAESSAENVTPVHTTASSDVRKDIDILSTRVTAPAVKIAPKPTTQPLRRAKMDHSDYGTPGPGAYTDSILKVYSVSGAVNSTNSIAAKRGRFSTPTSTRARVNKRLRQGTAPGPGDYDTDRAISATRQTVPGFSNVFRPESDSKNTPQLQKKKYWEEKARDVREEYDLPDDRVLAKREKVRTVKMRPEKKEGVDFRNREIMRKIQAEKHREASIGAGTYDKKYDAVETRPHAPVRMDQQVKAAEKTKSMLEKAGIIPASSRRKMEEAARDKFLGPQLPVPWGDELVPPKREAWKEQEEGYESPTEEVMELLARRRGETGSGASKPSEPDTTEAFLRSSFSGGLHRKPAAVAMHKRSRNDARRLVDRELTVEERERDYLPTQLHSEWGTGTETDHRALQMDLNHGRHTVKVLSKGIVDRVSFNDPVRPSTSGLGPGVYDMDVGKRIGEGVAGVDFKKYTGREDVVGPKGERPTAARDGFDVDENGFRLRDEVIVDAPRAKEALQKRPQVAKLYAQERHEVPKDLDEGQRHLGGSWFEGMAEDVAKKPAYVKYDAMVGREGDDEKGLDDLGSLIDQGREGDAVQVDVRDWKPHKERVISAPQWADPLRDPRFDKTKEEEKSSDAPPSPEPNYSYGKPRDGVGFLDFSRQGGRWDDIKDQEVLMEEEGYGRPDVCKVLDDALDEDVSKVRAEEKQSSRKRTVTYVDMDRQGKRELKPVKSAAPDVVYEIKEDKREKGVMDWKKDHGRDLKVITKEKLQANADERLSDDEEVIVSPHHDVKSSSRRTVSAPAWSANKKPIRPDPPEPLGNQLEYNFDPDYGKPGRNKDTGGVGMALQSGREDDAPLRELVDGLDEEELDIEPDYRLLKSGKGDGAARGGVPWGKSGSLPPRVAEKLAPSDDPPEGGVLILDPGEEDWNKVGKKGLGLGGRAGQDSTRPGAADALQELDREREELRISPVHIREGKNTQSAWRKESDAAVQSNPEVLKEYRNEELVLSPRQDRGLKPNTQPSWNKQKYESNDNFAAKSLTKDAEELILSPKEPQPDKRRTAAASWKKQSSADVDATLSDIGKPEVLILSPKKPAGDKKMRAPSWNKEHDSTFDGKEEYIGDKEELKLSPRDVGTRRTTPHLSWDKQTAPEQSAELSEFQEEELILSPKEVRGTGNRYTVAWNDGTAPSPSIPEEELKLSPREARDRKAGGVWQKSHKERENGSSQRLNPSMKSHNEKSSRSLKKMSVTWQDQTNAGSSDHLKSNSSDSKTGTRVAKTGSSSSSTSSLKKTESTSSSERISKKGSNTKVSTTSKGSVKAKSKDNDRGNVLSGKKKTNSQNSEKRRKVSKSKSREQNQESAPAPTPPSISVPTPTRAEPVGFSTLGRNRSDNEALDLLDKQLEELELK